MRAVFGLVLIVGIALAGGAVMLARNYMEAHRLELEREKQGACAATSLAIYGHGVMITTLAPLLLLPSLLLV